MKHLHITTHSYRDNTAGRTRHKATLSRVFTEDGMSDNRFVSNDEYTKWEEVREEEVSCFETEYFLITGYLLRYFGDYIGIKPIKITTSERAMPKLVNRINTLIEYCHSEQGKHDFKNMTIGDLVTHIMYDQVIFDPRTVTADTTKHFIEKFVSMVQSHPMKTIRVLCERYKAENKDEHNEEVSQEWQAAFDVRSKVLLSADVKSGLSKEDTDVDVKRRHKRIAGLVSKKKGVKTP